MRTIELDFGESNNYFVREAFNTLRTNILFSGRSVKTIIVTSCVAHEGKTTVCFEMAKSLAEANKKVLLIDADLRKSVTVSRYTKERGVYGLSQILSGQVDLVQAVYRTQYTGMDVIFAGPFPPNPAELVGSPTFREVLDCLRDSYDYIIVDAPPLGLVIDAAIMANVCDGSVIVIDQGNVKYRVAQDVKNQLTKSGCRILGVVLNQTQRRKRSLRGGKSPYYGYYSSYYTSEAASGQAETPSPAAPATSAARPQQTQATAVRRPAPPQAGAVRPLTQQRTGAAQARPTETKKQ